MKMKKQNITKADLERKLKEALAGQAHVYHFAELEIEKMSVDHLLGSGIILSMQVLGGRKIVESVLIRDGLSKETITAIKADLKRSYELAIMFKPKGE